MLDLFQPVIPSITPTRQVTPLATSTAANRLASKLANLVLARAAKSAKAALVTPEQRRERRRQARENKRRAMGMKPQVRLTPEQRQQYHRDRHARMKSDPDYRARKAKAAREWRARQKQKRIEECAKSDSPSTTTKGRT